MAITVFQTNTETGLAGAAADLLAKDATFDDSSAANENAQFLTWLYMLVKAIRARQLNDPTTNVNDARDRVLELVGGHTATALMQLVTDIEPVYMELYALFNSNDTQADDPWGTNLMTNGTGPQGGPIMGSRPISRADNEQV